MIRFNTTVFLMAVVALGSGCQDHEFHPPAEEETLELADSLYDPVVFDSVTWSSDEERVQAGNLVYADECRRCHGAVGRGDTDYAREQELDVPSLVDPEWELADDLEEVRRRIFTGHTGGMPAWGAKDLAPRQVDAAAFYILEQLRPEILTDTTTLPPAN